MITITIVNWTEHRPILSFPVDGYIEVNYLVGDKPRTKRVGCFSVFADFLRSEDWAECERMLEELEERKD